MDVNNDSEFKLHRSDNKQTVECKINKIYLWGVGVSFYSEQFIFFKLSNIFWWLNTEIKSFFYFQSFGILH